MKFREAWRGFSASLLLLCLLVFGLQGPTLAEAVEYRSTDNSIRLLSAEDFSKTFNPHAILALQTSDEVVVLVTSRKKEHSLTKIYDQMPSTFEEGALCKGRVMLSLDGEQAATFLVEGMFPPGEESTHDTVYIVANHGELEYTLMIHYPSEMGDEGFEWAVALLNDFAWI